MLAHRESSRSSQRPVTLGLAPLQADDAVAAQLLLQRCAHILLTDDTRRQSAHGRLAGRTHAELAAALRRSLRVVERKLQLMRRLRWQEREP